jgi:hypothetical protein
LSGTGTKKATGLYARIQETRIAIRESARAGDGFDEGGSVVGATVRAGSTGGEWAGCDESDAAAFEVDVGADFTQQDWSARDECTLED